jgi:drug/metabolite transporter (DMT)-like permease
MRSVRRIGRILDLAGLVLFLVGAGFFARAWVGFRRVPVFVPDGSAEPWAALRFADGFLRLQWLGGGLMAVGAAVFVVAWLVARRASAAEDEASE